jgi:hypothetical protein
MFARFRDAIRDVPRGWWVPIALLAVVGLLCIVGGGERTMRQVALREQIEETLRRIEARRGNQFTDAQRACVHDAATSELGRMSLSGLSELTPDERDQRIEGLVRFALMREGETLPLPDSITADMIAGSTDEELFDVLYEFACRRLEQAGGYRPGQQRAGLEKLPRGLQLVYLLNALDGEVGNGGFEQFFTNSSGELVPETLAACELIGCRNRAKVLRQAIDIWEPARRRLEATNDDRTLEREFWNYCKREIQPKLDECDTALYQAWESEPVARLLAKYIRSHRAEILER